MADCNNNFLRLSVACNWDAIPFMHQLLKKDKPSRGTICKSVLSLTTGNFVKCCKDSAEKKLLNHVLNSVLFNTRRIRSASSSDGDKKSVPSGSQTAGQLLSFKYNCLADLIMASSNFLFFAVLA